MAKRKYACKNARREGTCGLNDVAVMHDLFDAESRKNDRHDPDKGVGHPTAGADMPPKAKGIVNGGRHVRVFIGSDEAFWLECEGI